MLPGIAVRGGVAVTYLSGFFLWLLGVLRASVINVGPRCAKLRVSVGFPRGGDVLVLVENERGMREMWEYLGKPSGRPLFICLSSRNVEQIGGTGSLVHA
jgi:hypothetical protein